MSLDKGFSSALLFLFFTSLLGCSGSSSENTVKPDFSFTPQLEYVGLETPVDLDQLTLSKASLDYLTFYEIANAFVGDHYLIIDALNGSVSFKPTVNCQDEGYVSIATTRENNDWRLMFSYFNCKEGGITRSGKLIYSFPDSLDWVSRDGFSVYFEQYAMAFFTGARLSLHGRVSTTETYAPKTIQIDLTVSDHNGRFVKADGLSISTQYKENDNGAYSGRIYYPERGYIDIHATNGFAFDESSSWPVAGGQLRFSGQDSQAYLSIKPDERVWIELHKEGEITQALLLGWDALDIETLPAYGAKPIARASEKKFDYTNLEDAESITLDASLSSDPENKLLTYEWSIVTGPEGHSANIVNPLSPTPTLYPDRMGTYEIQLIVSDGLNKSDAYLSKVVLESGAYRARASMTRNQELPGVKGGRLFSQIPIHFDASNSQMMVYPETIEFINLTYKWRVVSGPAGANAGFSDPSLEKPEFISDSGGTFVIGLVVNDGLNDSIEEELIVRIEDYNTYAPNIYLTTLPFGYINEPIFLTIRARSLFGPDASESEWTLVNSPENSQSSIASVNALQMTFNTDTAGKYVFQVVASSESAQSEVAEIVLYVDEAPLFEIETLIDDSVFNAGSRHEMPLGLAVYDANQDGKDDIVFPVGSLNSSGEYNKVWFLHQLTEQSGFESQAQEHVFDEYQGGLFKLAGFSSNPTSELLSSTFGVLQAFEVSDDGGMTLRWSQADLIGFHYGNDQVLVKDLNHNGYDDFVTLTPPTIVDSIARELKVYRNNGEQSIGFSESEVFSLSGDYGWYDIKAADVRGDGRDDILVTSFDWEPSVPGTLDDFVDISKMLYLEMREDGTYEQPVELDIEGFPNFAINNSPQFEDIDGDGDLDIAGIVRSTRYTSNGGIGFWLQDEFGDFKLGETLLNNPWTGFTWSVRNDAQSLRLADLNNDGLSDIVLLNQNYLTVFFQTSAGEFNRGQNYKVAKDYAYRASFMEPSDIDSDGDMDLIVAISDSSGARIVQLRNLFIN